MERGSGRLGPEPRLPMKHGKVNASNSLDRERSCRERSYGAVTQPPTHEQTREHTGAVTRQQSPRRTNLVVLSTLCASLIAICWMANAPGLWFRSLAESSLRRHDSHAALSWAERASWISPRDPAAQLLAARAQLQLNMNVAARQLVKRSAALGAPRRTLDAYELMIAAQRGELEAADELLGYVDNGPLPSETFEAIIRCAQQHGQLTRAALILDQLEQTGTALSVVAYQRGRNCEIAEDFSAAVLHYAKALQLEPHLTRAAFRTGMCYYRLRKFEQAEEMLRRALRQPYTVVSSIELASCLWEQNKLEEAQAVISLCLDEKPAKLHALYMQLDEFVDADRAALVAGRIHDALGQSQQAVEMLQLVLASNHRDFEALSLLIKNLRSLDRHRQADELTIVQTQMIAGRKRSRELLVELSDVLPGDPESIDKRCELAALYWQTESAAEARLAIKEILELDPNCERATRLLAEIDREQANQSRENSTPR